MKNIPETIPGVVAKLMQEPVWEVGDKTHPTKGLLYIGLPDALEKAADHYNLECDHVLQSLVEQTGHDDLTHLKLSDGSLQEAQALIESHRDGSGLLDMLINITKSHRKEYEQILDDRAFIIERLIPALNQLGEGTPPTKEHQAIITYGAPLVGLNMDRFMRDHLSREASHTLYTSFCKLQIMIDRALTPQTELLSQRNNVPSAGRG